MNRFSAKALLIAALLCGCSAAAMAYPTLDAGRRSPPIPSATALADTAPALAPMAFVQFCMAYQDQCDAVASAPSVTLDADSWENLHRVNREVNEAIAPDAAKGGYDWSLETRLGNCNDYAIQKRQALIRLGYPMAALSLAVVRTAFGEGHLVLTVRTDRGDFVLDNRRTTIVAWNRTGYSWLKRQSVENPQQWVALSGKPGMPVQPAGRAPAVAPETPDPRSAVALVGTMDTVPLPAIGLAAQRLDTLTTETFPKSTRAIGETISHVAAGRRLAMLAFDELGRWSL